MTRTRLPLCIAAFFASLPLASAVERWGVEPVLMIGGAIVAGTCVGIMASLWLRPKQRVADPGRVWIHGLEQTPKQIEQWRRELDEAYAERWGER